MVFLKDTAFFNCDEWGYSLVAVQGLLIAEKLLIAGVASLLWQSTDSGALASVVVAPGL